MARPGLDHHPKFRRLMLMLQARRSHVRGYLECLWEVGHENGDPLIGDETDVVLACDFPGSPADLVNALLTCGGTGRAGFIEDAPGRPGVYQIHDMLINAPSYVAARAQREAERQKPKACPECGTQFHSSDSRAKFCSPNCRKLSWKKDQRGDASATEGDASATEGDASATEGDASATEGDATPAHSSLHTAPCAQLPSLLGASPPNPQPADGDRGEHSVDDQQPIDRPAVKRGRRAKGAAAATGFSEFWDRFPKKVARVAAEKAWRKLGPDADLIKTIMAAVDEQKRSDAWTKDGGRYVPNAATWLNGQRWTDEVQLALPAAGRHVNLGGITVEADCTPCVGMTREEADRRFPWSRPDAVIAAEAQAQPAPFAAS